ncbi:MAG: RNA polymerase sigma factor [Ktedonobacterales bacterium]|nr:RNA polymerase sigma factor [Ktedonobacterales bacterium]
MIPIVTVATFGPFYETHQAALTHHIWRMVRDADLAADLSQETFTRALVALQSGTHVTTHAWIYRIATNFALDELRRRRVIRQIPFADLAVVDGDMGFDIVDAGAATFVDRLADADAFGQIWQQLTPAERTTLLQILAPSPAAGGRESAPSKMRRSRARQHLRQLWQEMAA